MVRRKVSENYKIMINIQENIPLAQYTTFRIGGPAKYFVEINTEEELLEALKYAKENNLEFFVLGGGSNLLVSDKGFDGLAIKMKLNNFKIDINNGEIEAGAGVPLAKVVRDSAEDSLSGMEWAAGIPGTVGGAVRGNAGAFNGDISGAVSSVRILDISAVLSGDTEESGIKNYELSDCQFGYRDSIFKHNKNLIILSAVLKLQKGIKEESQKKIQEIIQKRISVQPQGMASAGSFFVNPVVKNEELIEDFEKESGKKSKEGKVPAPWIIERADLKGKKMGGAMVSEVHANYIVNTGNATAEDVIMLASYVKQQVRDKFGVELKEEVQYLGF